MLHICLAFRDADGLYALHAAASLVSVLQHTAMPLELHCIHDESLRPQGRHCLERVAAHFGKNMCFHDVRNMLAKMPDIHIPLLGLGSLYRYFIPECITAEHVLYLDCDICCTCDVAELYEDARAHPKAPLACVLDDGVRHVPAMKAYIRSMGLNAKIYFNSGVLV